MNHKIYAGCFVGLLVTGSALYAQGYKTAAAANLLNKELTEVRNEVAILNGQLTVAQNNLPYYLSKAYSTGTGPAYASITTYSAAPVRKVGQKTRKTNFDAQESREASDAVNSQNAMISSLTDQLAKKQERLQQLTDKLAEIGISHQ